MSEDQCRNCGHKFSSETWKAKDEEIERLRAELKQTLDAGATWERAYWDTSQQAVEDIAKLQNERDEAREAARTLYRDLWCGNDRYAKAWPWLED